MDHTHCKETGYGIVWEITRGEFRDNYRDDRVFSSKRKADAYATSLQIHYGNPFTGYRVTFVCLETEHERI